ncbi:aa3-type cytochrome oxidase subunit CtaJ [Actinoplanes sp. CA-054009]
MSISSTVLVFVVIPAVIIGLIATLVLAGADRTKRTHRYRPGRPYDFQPIWFLARPEKLVGSGHAQPALTGGPVLEDSSGAPVKPGSTGGASDSW